MRYHNLVCGGTFDHFHKGHEEFLLFGIAQSDHIVVGLTTNAFAEQKEMDGMEPYAKRKNVLEDFLAKNGKKWKTVPIDDMFGPTLSPTFQADAILVSESTKKGAEMINSKREEKGLLQLSLLIAPSTLAQDNLPISSSRIRRGDIDRKGRLWVDPSWLLQTLVLPNNLRSQLAKPFGEVIKDFDAWMAALGLDKEKLITVGDVVTDACNKLSVGQKISVVDLHVGRSKKFETINEHGFSGEEILMGVRNESGTLSPDTFKAVSEVCRDQREGRFIIQIDGEEDLVVLPLLLASPLGFTIVYGQPDQGVVVLPVTEESKRKAYDLVSLFTSS